MPAPPSPACASGGSGTAPNNLGTTNQSGLYLGNRHLHILKRKLIHRSTLLLHCIQKLEPGDHELKIPLGLDQVRVIRAESRFQLEIPDCFLQNGDQDMSQLALLPLRNYLSSLKSLRPHLLVGEQEGSIKAQSVPNPVTALDSQSPTILT